MKHEELALLAAKNEITGIFVKEKKASGKKRLPPGRLSAIISEVKKRNFLPDDSIILESGIRSRVKNRRISVLQSHPGPQSPLIEYEMDFVKIITQMARMRECLSPSECVALINSMIDGTHAQKNLIEWKKKSTFGESGEASVCYWKAFKRRNGHLICSKRGQKYELDRDKWTTYHNFASMYTHDYEAMEDAGIAKVLDLPVWMDKDGNLCSEDESFGCKVTHDLQYPEMAFVMDEVGGNTSQKGDGHIGGKLLVCAKGMTPQIKINTKDKRWTLLGLTSLNGAAVMCIIIFVGVREQAIYETGMDIFAEQIGEVSDEDFFANNSGTNKRYPGGPTCTFQGKEVPCLTRWSPNGSITSAILIDILATLDYIKCVNRSNGRKPFLLVDGHGSRFQLDFLKYVIDPNHEWVVVIGVPYGTALWQVGDSSEQNGAYNISLAKGKEILLKKKQQRGMKPTIEAYDIIPLINYAWTHSFSRNQTNRAAIAERGWGPLNRNLMLDRTLRSTMTDSEINREESFGIFIPTRVEDNTPPTTSTATMTLDSSTNSYPSIAPAPLINTAFLTTTAEQPRANMNYSQGTAAFCLDTIVQHTDLMDSRERIRKQKIEGKSIEEQISEQKGAFSAGKAVNCGLFRIGQTVFDRIAQNTVNTKRIANEKGEAARVLLQTKVTAANELKAMGISRDKLTGAQLKILLAPLKRAGDRAMPTTKKDLYSRLVEWEARGGLSIEEEVAIVVRESDMELKMADNDSDEHDDADDQHFEEV